MATVPSPFASSITQSPIVRWILANPILAAGLAAVVIPTMLYVTTASWSTEQGGHGPIVMAAGLWLIFRQLPAALALAAPPPGRNVALLFVPLLIAYYLARVTQIIEAEGYLMYALVLTVLYSAIGGAAMRKMMFPLFFLLFMFPPPDQIVAAITQPLKIALSQTAISLLYTLGYPIAGAGVTIQIGQYELLVAQACSGLNSMISLSAISLFYVYMRHQSDWRYALLLMTMVLPVAVFANFVRILILILLTYYAGENAAQGFLHDFAGITMFMTALLTIFAIDSMFERLMARARQRKDSVHG
ncbi:MAG TPA: exosortase V [Candidatus Polarisedimenticolia bacterium]|nr:exosortase V [Candidatus Polarisedimenticolia bacterium]